MPRKIEKNAKSKEEALKLAAEELGVGVDELSYTVEREIGKGLLGRLLGREVIISAWVTKEAEEEERLRRTREQRRAARQEREAAAKSAAAPKRPADGRTQPPAKPTERKAEQTAPQKPAAEAAAVRKKDTPERKAVADTAETAAAEPKKETKNRKVTEKSVSDAKYFAENLIRMMGLDDASVTAENGGSAVNLTVSGERMGLLIGKRGETLDAVQYLTSLYVNKEKNSYIKINLDTEGYRAKREETLVKLAHSLERKVIREGRAVTLEPMSPNERRIIHAALQGSSRIKTYSVGNEPSRKVVVALQD
ncbi:MAG TPA: KH domain-containing protein [Candidatus Monoglobus merdigallinarum]|uniref:RNA-binding protein KhpB n=1 Tax=Candidatus Monoglobus merdigallinarum TaxID=2838698 RepID=A0A9D1TKW4_9FIRM|nr:KH domain-containing protein [Candidatus Monoglobus merdigallinarum]